MARKVYGIKTPEDFTEPSLFDFQDVPDAGANMGARP
jgi:hypothetical protein